MSAASRIVTVRLVDGTIRRLPLKAFTYDQAKVIAVEKVEKRWGKRGVAIQVTTF